MPPARLYDFSQYDFENPLVPLEEIRRVNPQRHEMEQLTAIVHIDEENHGIVGYKDVTDQEFWIAGHMPGYALMPGVIQLETAAQLAGYYAQRYKISGGDFMGFGGMDDVRFRRPIFPNCRLVLAARLFKLKPNLRAEFEFQGFVEDKMVFNGRMIGVPITREQKLD